MNKTRVWFFLIFFKFMSLVASEPLKVAVCINKLFIGETGFANKILQAGKNLGWQVDILEKEDITSNNCELYDFAIILTPENYSDLNCKKYLCIFLPMDRYFNSLGNLVSPYDNYDGYLLSFDPKEHQIHNKTFENKSYLIWYPTSYIPDFQSKNFDKLFWINCVWGSRTNEKKYIFMLTELREMDLLHIYGIETKEIKTSGIIPFEGENLLKIAAQYGIHLVLHSETHIKVGSPTGRIFEALAVGNIIICDEHPFVKKNFKDNVLYIDTSKSDYGMFLQVCNHISWIKNNPIKARDKAKKAHEIFRKNFSLENQLKELELFNNKIESEER